MSLALPLPGLYNVYNALAAVGLLPGAGHRPGPREARARVVRRRRSGGPRRSRSAGATAVDPADQEPRGRERGASHADGTARAAASTATLDLWISLNDGIADGRDISWIWDADFELLAGRADRVVCSGTRAEELALRLKYAGVDASGWRSSPVLEEGLDTALAPDGGRPLYALPTYTALLELRDLLADRGHAPPFWE